jgi:hypothetical protein
VPSGDAAGSGWSCDATQQQCTYNGAVPAGGHAPVLTGTLTASSSSYLYSLNEYAEVLNDGDADTANNYVGRTLNVTAGPVDLSATIAGGGPVQAGGADAYTIQVNNTGFLDSSGPVTVYVPSGDAAGSGWSCDATQQQCTYNGAVPAGGHASLLTGTVTAPTSFPVGADQVIHLTASVQNNSDVDQANNSTSLTDPVVSTP